MKETTKVSFTIDATALRVEERAELAKLLFKSGYSVRLVKLKKDKGSRTAQLIACEGEE